MKTKLIVLASFFLFLGCGQNSDSQYNTVMEDPGMKELAMELDPATSSDSKSPEAVERKIIKTAVLEFETKDLVKTKTDILKALSDSKGYAVQDREDNSSYRKSNFLQLRVPSQNFDKLLSSINNGVDYYERKEISAQDVTEEFLDVEARLITKKKLEARYQEILIKANTVTDILEIERQINNVRGEIESIEGRLNYLKSQVSFSTLEITFYKTVSGTDRSTNKFSKGFSNGWSNLVSFLVGLVNIWPFLLLIGVFIYFFLRWRRKRN